MEMETKNNAVNEIAEVTKPDKKEKPVQLPKSIMLQDKGGTFLVRIALDEKRHEKRYYRVASRSGGTFKLEDRPYKTRVIKCPFNMDKQAFNTTKDLFDFLCHEKGYTLATGFKA